MEVQMNMLLDDKYHTHNKIITCLWETACMVGTASDFNHFLELKPISALMLFSKHSGAKCTPQSMAWDFSPGSLKFALFVCWLDQTMLKENVTPEMHDYVSMGSRLLCLH